MQNKQRTIRYIGGIVLFLAAVLSRGDYLWFFLWSIILGSVAWGIFGYLPQKEIDMAATNRRLRALKNVKIYMEPYTNIWQDLTVANKYCSLKLGASPDIIFAEEKTAPFRRFLVINSHVHSYEDLWDMFCSRFTHRTTYKALKEQCEWFKVSISEIDNPDYERQMQIEKVAQDIENQNSNRQEPEKELPKIDINNCSEITLTELPGINIVIAKKIIQKREELNGFKSEEDFLNSINLTPHMQNRLKNRIVINKMKVKHKIQKHTERNLDL